MSEKIKLNIGISQPIDVVIASPSKMYLLNKLDQGFVIESSLYDDKNMRKISVDRDVTEMRLMALIERYNERLIITQYGHSVNKEIQDALKQFRKTLHSDGDMVKHTPERILCCLETWIKELKENKNDEASKWIINTYENEIKNGDYVSDEEFEAWLTKRSQNNELCE